jgi:hypothetical protein
MRNGEKIISFYFRRKKKDMSLCLQNRWILKKDAINIWRDSRQGVDGVKNKCKCSISLVINGFIPLKSTCFYY